MKTRRLHRLIDRYGIIGLLLAGTHVLGYSLWRQRRAQWALGAAVVAMLFGLALWNRTGREIVASPHPSRYATTHAHRQPEETTIKPNSRVGLTDMQRDSAAPSLRYRLVDLGDLGGKNSWASDINQAGEVVGDANTSEVNWPEHAFHWKQGKLTDLGTGGYSDSTADALNNTGLIVGSLLKEKRSQAVLWKNRKIVNLPLLPGYETDSALGINDHGQIVGVMSKRSESGRTVLRACLWEGDRVIDLGTLPGDRGSLAHKINAAGQIVGVSGSDVSHIHACLWMKNEKINLAPEGVPWSEAHAINDKGVIVGQFQPDPHNSSRHAFLYRDGKMIDLSLPPPWVESVAYGINNRMQVVGQARAKVKEVSKRCAFLWSDGKMVDLNSLLPAGSRWRLDEARAINDRGEIVGNGDVKDRQGNELSHAFLLVPKLR